LSSILKALKKLENQVTDKNHVRSWQPETQTPIDDHKQINDHPRLKKRNVIIFAGVIFAVGAGLILSQKLYEKKPELITKKEDILQKPVRLPEKKAAIPDKKIILQKPARLPQKEATRPDKKAIFQKPVRLPQKKVAMPDKKTILQKPERFPQKEAAIPDKKTIIQEPDRLPQKKVAMPDRVQTELSSRKDVKKFEPIARAEKTPPPSAQKSRENTAVLFNKKTSPLKQARKETVAGKPSEKPEQNTKADRFASMPVKRSNQTQIEVQAIAWANDPKNRLAVINGLILRERESIDNVIVMHIGKDEVIFKKGGEEWRQMFGF
jgi:hypothetical protein